MENKKILNTWNGYNNEVFVKFQTDSGKTVEKFVVPWYFLWHEKDTEKVRGIMRLFAIHPMIEKVSEYYRVYIEKEEDRKTIILKFEEMGVQTYEGDLMPDKIWYVNTDIEIGTKFDKLYIDIETDDSHPIITVGKDRILSFAAVDDKGKMYFETIEEETDEAEAKMLEKILKIIKKYDILLGWNTSEFDIPYLRDRMFKFGLNKSKNYCWKELGKYDLLKRFRHIFRFDSHIKSFSLENISRHFLNKGKIPHTEKIIELYRNNKELLKKYNLEDCLLVKELDEKLGVSDMMIRQSQWCKVPPSKFGLYSIIDSYILRKAHSVNKYCKTSVNALIERNQGNQPGNMDPNATDTEKAKYTGAIVLDPVVGKYDNVYTFDFKGLYPSMMRTSNIGYDSIRYEAGRSRMTNPGTLTIKRKSGPVIPTYFEKEPSVINLAITDLITKRGEYKDLKLKMIEEGKNRGREWEKVVSDEIIVKELANSTYGIMGLEYGRYFSVDVAESITLFGQWCINFAKSHYESLGYKVIYGDTDSVFVSTGKDKLDVEGSLKLFHERIQKTLKETYNIDKSFIQLNPDKIYDSFLLLAKKTYVGHVINMEGKKVNEVYARGMEFHKKNTFSFAAEKQEELINLILNRTERPDVEAWIKDVRNEFYDREFTKEELIITQRVGKKIEEYAGTPTLHVRLAQGIKARTGVDMHRAEIDFIVTDSIDKANGVLAEDYQGKFDRDYYWLNKTLPVLERVLTAVYPGEDLFNPTSRLF